MIQNITITYSLSAVLPLTGANNVHLTAIFVHFLTVISKFWVKKAASLYVKELQYHFAYHKSEFGILKRVSLPIKTARRLSLLYL